LVYPVLYKALAGYGIPESAKDVPVGSRKGPAVVQIRALHEVILIMFNTAFIAFIFAFSCF
jgi:hypothetical protein